MAMCSKRGQRPSTKAFTFAMMKAGGRLESVKREWMQQPTIDGRVVIAISG
jgi:hypothetical protein